MVDIHAHILPGVDDGPTSMVESLGLLHQAEKEGITDIVVTPHAYHPQYNVMKDLVVEKYNNVKEELAKLDLQINLHLGQEIRIGDSIVEQIKEGKALTLANSKYVLLELPSSNVPNYTIAIIQELLYGKSTGYCTSGKKQGYSRKTE